MDTSNGRCRFCGLDVREGDDAVGSGADVAHTACTEPLRGDEGGGRDPDELDALNQLLHNQ